MNCSAAKRFIKRIITINRHFCSWKNGFSIFKRLDFLYIILKSEFLHFEKWKKWKLADVCVAQDGSVAVRTFVGKREMLPVEMLTMVVIRTFFVGSLCVTVPNFVKNHCTCTGYGGSDVFCEEGTLCFRAGRWKGFASEEETASARSIWWETAIAEVGTDTRLDVSLCCPNSVTDVCRNHGIRQIWWVLASVHHVHQNTHLVLDAELDGQPVKIFQRLCTWCGRVSNRAALFWTFWRIDIVDFGSPDKTMLQ